MQYRFRFLRSTLTLLMQLVLIGISLGHAVGNASTIVDDFDRAALGPDWVVDSGSYAISGNTLVQNSGSRFLDAQMRYVSATTDSEDQFGKIQIVSPASHTFGFMFRAGAMPGNHYEVHLPTGSSVWRWERYDPGFVERVGECAGSGVLSDGNWIGATVEGSAASTLISVWRWNGDPDLGGPVDIEGNWGPPDCTITPAGTGFVDSGNHVGIRAYTGSSTASGFADNWTAGDVVATPQTCGNGFLDAGEQCDDGNTLDGDGCRGDCTAEVCGDGILDVGEQCDDGNTSPGDGCDGACMLEPAVCGNGILESGEQCDDGNLINGDGCDATCSSEFTLFSDDFDRAALGPDWVVDSGSFAISGNTLVQNSGSRFIDAQVRYLAATTASSDQFGKMQVVSPASHTFGFMFRAGATPGEHYEVHLPKGSSSWRWERYDPGFVERVGECPGSGQLSDGNWIGATVEGSGANSVVSVWRWNGDPDLGGPVDIDANWGPPDCTMSPAGTGYVDSGNHLGVRAYTGNSTASGFADNWTGGDIIIAPLTCGNGLLDTGEQCDDGNVIDGDGCRGDCTVEACGDGILDVGEQCDDGNTISGDGCDAVCMLEPAVCGNGVLESGEQCDDGNLVNGDGCRADCTAEICGDGLLDPTEQCDDGNTSNGDGCRMNCTAEICGDNILDAGEQCDDGNNSPGDGCDASCMIEQSVCGDGVLDAGEQCDDGNTVDGDGCRGDCTAEVCGDGILDVGEQCDDGNTSPGDGCDGVCMLEPAVCGNGVLEFGEQCDDGNLINGDGCDATCSSEFTSFSDDFDRAVLGPDWVVDSGSFAISGNTLVQNSGSRYIDAQMRYLAAATASSDQFGKMQVVSPASHTFGFMFRAGAAPGEHYEVHLPKGSTSWRWERYDPGFVERLGECGGGEGLQNGNWIGAAISGSGLNTEVFVWRWSDDPDLGGPVDIDTNWGPPDCTMTPIGTGYVDSGNHLGVRAFTGNSTASGFADNWTGGDFDGQTQEPDPSEELIELILDSSGEGVPNSLQDPDGIAIDSSGNIYVAACGRVGADEGVWRITPTGQKTQVLDSNGDGVNLATCPVGLDVDSADNVYVAAFLSDNVFRIAPDGTVTQVLDAVGAGAGQGLAGPIMVAVDSNDTVFVSGHFSHNVLAIRSTGTIDQLIDQNGDGSNSLLNPFAVEVDLVGNVVVAGFGSDNVFRISTAGGIEEVIDSTGGGVPGGLQAPHGLAHDSSNNLFVTGNSSDNVLRVTPSGVVSVILDSSGDDNGNILNNPTCIATGPSDQIYVAGFFSRNVFEVASNGAVTEILDSDADVGGGFIGPSDDCLAVDSSGRIYAAGTLADNVFRITVSE